MIFLWRSCGTQWLTAAMTKAGVCTWLLLYAFSWTAASPASLPGMCLCHGVMRDGRHTVALSPCRTSPAWGFYCMFRPGLGFWCVLSAGVLVNSPHCMWKWVSFPSGTHWHLWHLSESFTLDRCLFFSCWRTWVVCNSECLRRYRCRISFFPYIPDFTKWRPENHYKGLYFYSSDGQITNYQPGHLGRVIVFFYIFWLAVRQTNRSNNLLTNSFKALYLLLTSIMVYMSGVYIWFNLMHFLHLDAVPTATSSESCRFGQEDFSW